MDMLKTQTTPMKVYKPYKLSRPPSLNVGEQKTPEPESRLEGVGESGNGLVTPAALLPSPPPQQLYLYQMMQGPPVNRRRSVPPSPLSPFPPMPMPAAKFIPVSKTKPRTVHEYYDQHAFQWKEFNPEDTVIGDGTDPFIIYLRYVNKSIGARRTPYVLPKHAKLVKIMQDCLPDFDWRTGEDMLIKARVLYLRRTAIAEALEKLKRGDSIGPVTKAALDAKDEESEDDSRSATTDETKVEEVNIKEDNQVPGKERAEEESSTEMTVGETPKTSDVDPPKAEGEDTSDTHSTASDIPPTPASNEPSDSNTSDVAGPPIIITDDTIRDTKAIRGISEASETLKTFENGGDNKICNDDTPERKDKERFVEEGKFGFEFPARMDADKPMQGWEMLEMVLNWVSKEFSPDEQALARQLANNEISYRFLWLHFVPGSIVSIEDPVSKQQMAARVEFTEYIPASLNVAAHLEINVKIIDANGSEFIYSNMVANITEYDAAKRVEELPVQILTEDLPLYKTLKERGKKFVQLNGVHYMTLDGIIILKRPGQDIIRVRSKTRVMIDCKAFRESNPSYNHSFSGLTLADILGQSPMNQHHFPRYGITTHGSPTPPGMMSGAIAATILPKDIKTVPDDELVLCAPTVFGYAFTEKAWVQMTVDGISPVIWDTESYNKLVLPDDTKKLVKSLVQACRTDTKLIKDIISTKGSGVVFVLHGDPGTGKTLTAEAIGEELRRPILVIAVSDLGTDPTNVEIRLGSFLRTAEKWDSIVLLDEADIFLEQRGRQDIFRNAMVGVFLRLLEYHNSPMFLTTNRVFAFDPAIRSRISIAIAYKPLKRTARKQVWKQLLDMAAAKISPADLDEVSMSQVNGRLPTLGVLIGREIKNTIRSAQALAVADGIDLNMRHIKTVLDVQKEFREDFEGLPGMWNGMGVS